MFPLPLVSTLLCCSLYQSVAGYENLIKMEGPEVVARKAYYEQHYFYYFDCKLDRVPESLKNAVLEGDEQLSKRLYHEADLSMNDDADSDMICELARLSVIERSRSDMADFLARLAFHLEPDWPEYGGNTPECVRQLIKDIAQADAVFRALKDTKGVVFPTVYTQNFTYMQSAARDESWFVVDVLARYLIKVEEQSINIADSLGLSIFHVLCAATDSELVKWFLERQPPGFDINAAVSRNAYFRPGYTALHFAYERCRYSTVNVLLEHGANVNLDDVDGLQPGQVECKPKWYVYDAENGTKIKSDACKMRDRKHMIEQIGRGIDN